MNSPTAVPPRVSIGLAVRNGARYLSEAIDSILAQTFTDFELIICDNASTDATEEICRSFAARDARIVYVRNPRNIGGAQNENLTFRKARGEYFRWAAHDDKLAPTLLEKCVALLDSRPDVVLCYTQIVEIDENGDVIGFRKRDKGTASRAHRRLHQLMYRDHTCEMAYGLMRSSVMRQTRLLQDYTDCDRTLLCELALHGRYYELPELLFYKRYHPANEYLDWRARMSWFRPDTTGSISFPNFLQFVDMYATVARVPMPWSERALCYLVTARWSLRHSLRMAREVALAGYMGLHRREWRVRRQARYQNWE
jgi:glycosyltransferase involved in cell wall biosynthesis